MNITLEPGKYVVAVSGGVDSVALLHMLQALPGLRLTVAHFDHGIRPDSADDQRFVAELAKKYGLPYVHDRAELGPDASEAVAREARYEFLRKAREATGAQAVITAHHQDDVLETAILNIIRGTGRRGLSSLKSTDIVKRPLLHVPKDDLMRYASDNQLLWSEDSTNASEKYKRNYVRRKVLTRFEPEERQKLHDIIVGMRETNEELDDILRDVVDEMADKDNLKRGQFVMLPHAVAREVMATWLRSKGVKNIDKKMLERLVHAAKTFAPGRQVHANQKWSLKVMKNNLALVALER